MEQKRKALGRFICTALFFCTLLLMAPVALAAEGDTGTDGDFEWRELADGTVAVKLYHGSATDVTIPSTLDGKTVTMIEQWAFNSMGINSVTIPSGVTFIGYASFAANNLTKLTLPDGVTSIEDGAFWSNKIKSITIPSSVTTIKKDAFQINCISKITIESDTTVLGANVFGDQTVNEQVVTEWWDNTGTAVNIYSARSGGVTYYAAFTADVDFEENGGSAVADILGQNGFTLVAKPEDPTKDGFRFGGWYLDDATFEDEWNFEADVLEGDIVLYAKWVTPVSSVTLSSTTETLTHHDTAVLTATVLPENATYPEVTWTSSDESVAAVSADGSITATGVGSAVITATADGMSTTCEVTVNPNDVTSVTLSNDKANLKVGDEVTLTATVLPENATYPEVIWTTGNENVATVDTNGKVKAVGVGSAVITATADGKSAVCQITVSSEETTKPDTPKGSIRGRLADAKGEPLAGYTVVLHSDPITEVTNSNGEFVFENVPLTKHTLLIQETDGTEIGRYGLAFTQSDTASYTKDDENLDIKSTVNTVAIDVLIHVSEDGKTTSMDKVTIINNPKTGEDSMIWVWILCITAIVMGSIYGYCVLKNKFR